MSEIEILAVCFQLKQLLFQLLKLKAHCEDLSFTHKTKPVTKSKFMNRRPLPSTSVIYLVAFGDITWKLGKYNFVISAGVPL